MVLQKRLLAIFAYLIVILTSLAGCDEGSGSKCADASYQPTVITVKWTLNGIWDNGTWTSSFDTCLDYTAIYAHVLITGPEEFLYETTVSCNSMETNIIDDSCDKFPQGSYSASVTLLNSNNIAMTESATTIGLVSVSQNNPAIEVDIPLESFDGYETMTGTYRFNPTFDGSNCAQADPPVDSLDIGFYKDGVFLEELSSVGQCSDEFDISEVPVGDLTLEMIAMDATPTAVFCGTYNIKVGAGVTNPVFDHDVTAFGCSVNK
ncbi:hypothetical protein KKF84_19445 [Myxococcota bacterium]|nr:hypothetical protein [Myxococcota bacterium]MBU1537499.1 hypothetical protein [Myxococcota bacterium]